MSASEPIGWLFILGERAGLDWVLANERMAFSSALAASASKIQKGDQAFIYGTKKVLGGPVGRIVASAEVLDAATRERVSLVGGWNFGSWLPLSITLRVPEREGLPIRDHIQSLEFIRQKQHWAHYLRRGLVKLPTSDTRFLATKFRSLAQSTE